MAKRTDGFSSGENPPKKISPTKLEEADNTSTAESLKADTSTPSLEKGNTASVSRHTEPLPKDATYGEVKTRLRNLKERLSGASFIRGVQVSLDKTSVVNERYEKRALRAAENSGLVEQFNLVRSAREAYLAAQIAVKGRGYAEEGDNLGDLKLSYDRALFWWKNELTGRTAGLTDLQQKVEKANDAREKKGLQKEIGAGLTESEKKRYAEMSELAVISKRDTILGPKNVELEARERALTEKGKTALGRAEVWASRIPQNLIKGLNFLPNVIGGAAAHLKHRNDFNPDRKDYTQRRKILNMTPEERKQRTSLVEQETARRYARNVRILAGAGVATLLAVSATPVSVGGGLLAFAVYTARGAIGTVAGVGGAKAAGMGFNFFNKNRRAELKERISKAPATLEEYQDQQVAYLRNNSKSRSQEKMGWQMVAAMLTGAGVGAATSPLAHSFLENTGALPSVKEAAQSVADVNAQSPSAGAEAMRLSEALKASSEHTDPIPVPEPYSVSIQPGEGMDKLFVELREHYGKLYPDPTDPSVPPGIRHLLEAENGNELSRELHFINDNDTSYVMKAGDTLGFNEEGALVFTPESDPTAHVVLLGNEADGTLQTHALSAEEQHGHFLNRTEVPVAAAPAARVEAELVPTHNHEVTAQLNRDALGGHSTDSPAVAHETPPTHESVEEPETTHVPEHVADKVPPVEAVPPVPAHLEPVPAVTSEAPSVEHTPPVVEAGQPFINSHEVSVSPLETHAYSVVNEASPNGEQLVVFGGGDARDEAFLSRVQEIARENPGRKVYFDAGYPVDYNGVPQRWINSVVFDPENGISMGITPEGPEMIGTINPDSFINKVN